jgi:hypothetical protein
VPIKKERTNGIIYPVSEFNYAIGNHDERLLTFFASDLKEYFDFTMQGIVEAAL